MADVEIQQTPTSGSGSGWIWAIVVLILLAIIGWFVFGGGMRIAPARRESTSTRQAHRRQRRRAERAAERRAERVVEIRDHRSSAGARRLKVACGRLPSQFTVIPSVKP